MCVPVFVWSEKSNALVGGGFPQPAPRSANLDSAFGGMQLFATWAKGGPPRPRPGTTPHYTLYAAAASRISSLIGPGKGSPPE